MRAKRPLRKIARLRKLARVRPREAFMRVHQFAAAALLSAVISCGASTGTNEDPLTPASRIEDDSAAESEPEELGDLQACQSDAECAEGDVCGYDPDISQVVRYCMRL
jgi:hypothetical protein